MYLLPKIHKRLDNVPGRPVISNCRTPTEKASEFLDHHLQRITKSGVSSVKDTNDFLFKLKNLGKIPENAFLDVIFEIQQGEFVTDLYYKSTDGHQYLHFDSCHASHTKASIVYSQVLRMKRICSRRSDLIVIINKLEDWFREKGYPEEIVNKETKRALEF